jgi:ubiquinone/menaquinone biosynthesis C-methylase UbiE
MSDHRDKINYFNTVARNWYSAATEQQAEYVMRMLRHLHAHATSGDRVLDIGCGTGILFPFLSQYEVTGVDMSPEMVQRAQENRPAFVKEVLVADVHALPFDNSCFHHAAMLAVYPHIDYPEIALTEIRRVLAPKGTLSLIHTATRDVINHDHRAIGGAIENDLLPEEAEMHFTLTQAGFVVRHQETSEGYFFFAQKV